MWYRSPCSSSTCWRSFMAVDDVIRLLNVNPVYRNRAVHMETTEPILPHGTEHLMPLLMIPLNRISASTGYILYSHQCEAINRIRTGKECDHHHTYGQWQDTCVQHSGF